jgi:hypothetical protein
MAQADTNKTTGAQQSTPGFVAICPVCEAAIPGDDAGDMAETVHEQHNHYHGNNEEKRVELYSFADYAGEGS